MQEQRRAQAKQSCPTDSSAVPTKQEKKNAWNKAYYKAKRDAIRAKAKISYAADSTAAKARSKANYAHNSLLSPTTHSK